MRIVRERERESEKKLKGKIYINMRDKETDGGGKEIEKERQIKGEI